MKNVILALAAVSLAAPAFMGCAEKCAEDDAECIAKCVEECVKDECGEPKSVGDTTINEGIDYMACTAKLATDGKCRPSSCTE